MVPWWKKMRSSTSTTTSTTTTAATDEPAEDDHAPASQSPTRGRAEPRNEDRPPDLEQLDPEKLDPEKLDSEKLGSEKLAADLRVDPDATASAEDLIKRSAVKHFPSPPPEGGGGLTPELLEEHLESVRQTVHDELRRLSSLLPERLKSRLAPSYHRLAMDRVRTLLHRISTSQQAFVLMEWLCKAYLSRGFLGNQNFSENQHRSPVDMHLYSETVVCIHKVLRTALENDVKMSLDVIMKRQESEFWRSWELHTDVIKCIDGPIVRAESISENVQEFTRQVCYLQLQEFLESFNTAKQELLKRYQKTPKTTVETCLKTLNTLHGLVSYIQPSTDGGTRDLPAETLSSLRATETAAQTAAQTAMGEALVKIIKDRLKSHFKSREEDFLLKEVKEMFSAEDCCPDVQKEALDLAYERTTALYLWQLASTKKKELEKRWGGGVGQKVTQDAEHLHKTFSELHPGVRQQNHVLLKVDELIQSQDVDSVKLTLSGMMQLCPTEKSVWSCLLKWNGLSRAQVQEVLEAVQEPTTSEPRTLFSCIQ